MLSVPKCTNAFNETFFKNINGTAFKAVSSAAYFDSHFQADFSQPDTLFLVIGTDSGLLPDYIKKIAPESRIIWIEHPEVLKHLPNTPKNCWSNFNVSELEYIRTQSPDYLEVALIPSLAIQEKTAEAEYLAFYAQIQSQFGFWLTNLHRKANHTFFFHRFLTNLADCIHPVKKLQNTLNGMNAVVLGGGPSLDKALPWLKQHQQDILIFAAGRISKRLLQEKIQPDFITTIDPNEVIYDNSKEMVQFSNDSVLLHTNYSYPPLLTDWQGVKAYTEKFVPWEERNDQTNLMVEGPTVTNSMVGLAHAFGCENVFLLGVDFCYAADGQTHESQSIDSQSGQLSHQSDQTLLTYDGRKALTNSVFADAHRQLSRYVAQLPPHLTLFNTSQSAAVITGVEPLTLEEITLNTAEKQPILNQIKAELQTDDVTLQNHFQAVKHALTPIRKSLVEIQKHAKTALKTVSQMQKQPGLVDKSLQKINKIRLKIYGDDLTLAIIEHLVDGQKAEKAIFVEPADYQHDPQQLVQLLQRQFQTFSKLTTELIGQFDEALKQVQIRQAELKPHNLKKLAQHWQAHREEGRFLTWLAYHQLTLESLPEAEQKIGKQLLEQFEARTQTTDAAKLKKKLAFLQENTLDHLGLVVRLFDSQDAAGLEQLIQRLSSQLKSAPDQTKTNQADASLNDTLRLAQGFYHELNHRLDEACQCYTQLQDKRHLELGLLQIVQIGYQQNDPQTALNALEVLTHLKDDYLPSYAEAMEAQGQIEEALVIYQAAFHLGGQKLEVLLRLIQKLIQYDYLKEANALIDQGLKLFPDQTELTRLKDQLISSKS